MKECGADANAADKTGMTAVMWAAMGGHTATAVALVRTVLGEKCCRGRGGCRLVGESEVTSSREA